MRWVPLIALVLAQIAYPLAAGETRAALTVGIVALGFAASFGHAVTTRGARVAGTLLVVTAGGGLAVEALGIATGVPFGSYQYSDALGPRLSGVPHVVPLAWTWMAWPAWLAAGQLAARPGPRVALAGLGLATWDLFLDPQMVKEGYWQWSRDDALALAGVAGVPATNYAGWLAVAVTMMALFAVTAGARARPVDRHRDAPMLVLYLWTYVSCVVGHAAFLDLRASALWGGLGMGLVALPLAVRLARPARPADVVPQ